MNEMTPIGMQGGGSTNPWPSGPSATPTPSAGKPGTSSLSDAQRRAFGLYIDPILSGPLPRPTSYLPPNWEELFYLALLRSLDGGGAGAAPAPTPVVPPITSVLEEFRQRRADQAERTLALADFLARTLPSNLTFYPGFEPGGLADVLLGIITGRGVAQSAGLLPVAARQVERRPLLPIPVEPTVESEFPKALALANEILNAMRVV